MSRGGIQNFQPARLSQVLAARKLSQVQLASLVGVSAATISKWRAGSQYPEREALDRLANVVNVNPEWFTRHPNSKISPPFFRSNASAHVAARAMLEARMAWAQDIGIALSDFVDFPSVNLPQRTFTEPDQITSDEIERAACEFRDALRLGRGAIQDLALACEGAGIIIIREETGISQIEGLSAWSGALARPFVLLSADKDNGYRSRFDLAHEIGHLILHRCIARATERERHKQLEHQAHRFAGALLLPAEAFASEIRTPVTLDDLLLLKRRWGVSVAAIIMRLRALKVIDEDGMQSLFKRRSARWGAKAEPGDNDRLPERPRLLRRSIELLVDQNVMPLDMIPGHIGLSAHDIEMLTGLPEGYFSGTRTIVQLATLRSGGGGAPRSGHGAVLQFPKKV